MKEYYHVFPFNKIEKDSRIIIYGAWNVGGEYLLQIQLTDYCEVVFAVDKNYLNIPDLLGVAVLDPVSILSADYDYIVIAMADTPLSLQTDLNTLNLPEDKVIYPISVKVPANDMFPNNAPAPNWRTIINADSNTAKAIKTALIIDEMQHNSVVKNNNIRKYLADRLRERKLLIYGVGDEAVKLTEYFSLTGVDCCYFIDDELCGNEFRGKEIKSVADVIYEVAGRVFVLLANEKESYRVSREKFISLGLVEDIDFTYYLMLRAVANHPPYHFDATLSYNRVKEQLEGFELMGDSNNVSSIVIVALGGSATDSEIFSSIKGWPY